MLLKIAVVFLLAIRFNNGLKLGLQKEEPKQVKMLGEGRFAEFRQWKENHRQNMLGRFGNFASGQSKIQEYEGIIYKINASFGTPPQNFMLGLSIYDSYTYIPDKTVVDSTNKSISDKLDTFDSSNSSTYIKDGRTFGSYYESIQGFFGIDTVSLGDSNEIVIKNATFGQLTKLNTDPAFFNDKFDGALGLGVGKSDGFDSEPIFLTAIKENVVDKPVLTMWINRNSPNATEPKGQLTIGDFDTDHCDSNISYASISRKDWFEFKIDAVSVNNGEKQVGNWTAMIDIGGYFTTVPQSVLSSLVQKTNAKYDHRTGLYTVECNVKFQASIFIENTQLLIDEKSGVVKLDDFDSCFLAFEESESWDDPNFVFGGPFSLAYCIIYDNAGDGKIGFAKNL